MSVTRRRVGVFLMLTLLFSACSSGGAGPVKKIGKDKDIELSLARACVVVGEEQILKVRARPNSVAIFSTSYADGKKGSQQPFGAGYGGNDSEIVPSSGVVEMKWRISREAPPGPVVVDVGVLQDDQKETELKFELVKPKQSCP